ncbi:ead/Ea22-like family protein [Enterobacter roggenkampii]|uniref:ead/Ea22-like family protein n=1 Tax=Enterobacter roggenkampii TaxID=1812935 RepID=UPI00200683C5|nr:ead/Ea22-like family protein [Enterobacter roggenkampii]MCK7179496.1 ead/Ea22-like family protein [Enterobacter roggenkampii]
MSNIDKQALRQLAVDAKELAIIKRYTKGIEAQKKFIAEMTPATVLALLDELEAAEKLIAELEVVNELFLRAKALMYQSGGTPIDNSLNPIDAWLYDAERAAAACKGE